MKKLLLLILAILLSFSMVACDIQAILDGMMPPSSSYEEDEDEDDEEEEEEDDEDEDESSSSSIDESKNHGVDKTVYSNTVTEDGKWVYGDRTLSAPTFTNFYNGYKSALTMTFDDGYDIGTGRYVNSVFEQYGFRGTMMLGACFLESDDGSGNKVPNQNLISQWNTVLADGYLDVGCHGYDHLNPVGLDPSKYDHEIKDAIEFLREQFPGQKVLTFATPYAHIDNSYEDYLDDLVIANRLEADGGKAIKIGDDYNLYRVWSTSVRKDTPASSFNSYIGGKLDESGTWVVELLHCVLDTPYNSTDTSKALLSEHCAYISKNYGDTVWVASFEDVAIYLKQLETAKINYVASDRESMTINVTCPLDEEIYNYPMTVKLRVPAYATSAYMVVDGEAVILDVARGSGVNTVTVKNIPVNGEDVKIYLGGNYNYANDCLHVWGNKRVSATCSEVGYMLYECAICKVTYKGEFTQKRSHDFSNSRVTEAEPTLTEDGLDVLTCQACGTEKELVTSLKNMAPGSTITASDGINQWVYTSDMIDGNVSTKWTNGTATPYVELTFAESSVQYVEVSISKYGGTQFLAVSTYNGTEWTEIEANQEIDSSDVITVRVEVGVDTSGIRLDISGTASGCTMIHEITIIAKIDKN